MKSPSCGNDAEELARVEIRHLTPSDAPSGRDLVLLQAECWGTQLGESVIGKRAAKLTREIAAANPDTAAFLVAEESGQLVGMCQLSRDSENRSHWWILRLAVHPNHRRRRVGSALAHGCVNYVRRRGARMVLSETHASNTVSIRFHKGFGFENLGQFVAEDGDEKVAFRLPVG